MGEVGNRGLLRCLEVLKAVGVLVLVPLVIWTGFAMSPAFEVPWTVKSLGGRRSARTLHFVLSISLVL